MQLQGNRIVEAANSRFHASMVNELSWRAESDDPDKKEIVSDLTLEVRFRGTEQLVWMRAGALEQYGHA